MALTVNIGEAKTRLSELIHKAEAGEEIVIAHAGRPVVRLEPVKRADAKAAIAAIRAERAQWPKISIDEIIASKNAGRR